MALTRFGVETRDGLDPMALNFALDCTFQVKADFRKLNTTIYLEQGTHTKCYGLLQLLLSKLSNWRTRPLNWKNSKQTILKTKGWFASRISFRRKRSIFAIERISLIYVSAIHNLQEIEAKRRHSFLSWSKNSQSPSACTLAHFAFCCCYKCSVISHKWTTR